MVQVVGRAWIWLWASDLENQGIQSTSQPASLSLLWLSPQTINGSCFWKQAQISLKHVPVSWNSPRRDASPAPHSRRRCVHSKPTNAQCAREWAGTTPVPVTAQLNHHVARNDQVAAVLRKQLREIRVAEGTLFSELLASTLALIYKS